MNIDNQILIHYPIYEIILVFIFYYFTLFCCPLLAYFSTTRCSIEIKLWAWKLVIDSLKVVWAESSASSQAVFVIRKLHGMAFTSTPWLELKPQPRFHPVCLSLSMNSQLYRLSNEKFYSQLYRQTNDKKYNLRESSKGSEMLQKIGSKYFKCSDPSQGTMTHSIMTISITISNRQLILQIFPAEYRYLVILSVALPSVIFLSAISRSVTAPLMFQTIYSHKLWL